MANKKNNNRNGSLVKLGMPETMFSDVEAENVRSKLDNGLSELHFAIMDLREAGVPIESVEDVKSISREGIKSQLDHDKESYFKNMRFIPAGLRRQVNQEFAEMAAKILPLTDNLVRCRKSVPLSYTLNNKEHYKTGEYCVIIDSKEKEEYIRKAGTIQIPTEFREYYETLSDFCKAFAKLQQEAERLHISQPDRNLVLDLMEFGDVVIDEYTKEIKPLITNMRITPGKMFELIRSNRLRMKVNESEDSET